MKRLLLIGGSGQLGTALRTVLADRTVVAPERSEFDAVSGDAEALVGAGPWDAVVNCTAFTNVDLAEREPAPAFAVNAVAVDRLARACAAREVPFVTVSTDYVFAGTAGRPYREDDEALPRTVYGISKLAGELLARRSGPQVIIVRTSGLFGSIATGKGYTLIDKVLAQAERGDRTRMVDDVTFSPSYAPHVARAMRDLIDARAYGTHHVTNAGACSWFDFVRVAFAKAGLSAPLERTSYRTFGNPVQRPMYSPLENTTFAAAGIAPLPSWEDALDEYLASRAHEAAATAR
jgi:dTDP-4-dehydrorhamnose reductase